MDESIAAQDAFAELVAQCRSGAVQRMILRDNPKRTEYVPFKPDVDLNIPVFYEGEMAGHLEQEHLDANEAVQAGRLRLPYPRCGFLSRRSRGRGGDSQVPAPHRKDIGRYYFLLVEESGDEILVNSFVRHDDHSRWSQQTWQAVVTRNDVEIAYDPQAIGTTDAEFMAVLDSSNSIRLLLLFALIMRITSGRTSEAPAARGSVTERSNLSRIKAGLPEVSRLRVLTFDPAPPGPPRKGTSGTMKVPHFRHGGWRTLQSGKRVWVRPSAVHGGSADVPPWYEIRGS